MGTDSIKPADADALLARYRATGDPAALGELFDATAPQLFRLALHLAPDPASAEDALQETFLGALQSIDRHDPERPVVPWLIGILRNKALAVRRRESRTPDPARVTPSPAVPDPAVTAEKAEQQEWVHKALDELPEPYREVALLRYRHGLTPVEIAALKRTAPGTVRSLLHRATEKLRRSLGALSSVVFLPRGKRAPRGFSAVRTEVLRRAPKVAGSAAATAGTVSAVLLGEVLMKKAVLIVAALALLAGAAFFVIPPRPSPSPPTEPTSAAPSGPPSTGVRKAVARSDESAGGKGAAVAEQRGPKITGRVVDEKGRAILGAAVASYPDTVTKAFAPGSTARKETAKTGSDGRFEVRVTGTAPAYGLLVSAVGYSPAVDTEVRPGADVTVVLERPITLTGHVMDRDEKPIAGAKVKVLVLMGAVKIVREGTSGSDGSYRVEGVPHTPAGRRYRSLQVLVEADALGFAPLLVQRLLTFAAPGATSPFDVVLGRGATLTGKVVDRESGKPIVGARVVLWSIEGMMAYGLPGGLSRSSPFGPRPLAETKSGVDGAFAFDHVPARGPYPTTSHNAGKNGTALGSVAAWKAGYVAQSDVVDLAEEGAHLATTLRLFRAAVVTGRVVDERGKPVGGADIWATGSAQTAWIPNLYRDIPLPFGTTDAKGEFRLTGVPVEGDGTVKVTVDARTPRATRVSPDPNGSVTVTAKAGEEVQAPDLVVHPVGGLASASIRVVDEKGSPVWGALVWGGGGLTNTRTDREGRAEITAALFWRDAKGHDHPTKPQPITLIVRAPNLRRATVTVTPADPPPPAVRVTLSTGSRLTGRVLESDGSPARGVLVMVGNGNLPVSQVLPAPNGSVRAQTGRRHLLTMYGRTHTTLDGTFSFTGLPPGPYHVRAQEERLLTNPSPGEQTTRSGVEAGSDVTLVLPESHAPATGSIRGSVTDAATGEPVWGARLWLLSGTRYLPPSETGGPPNEFRFTAVTPGAWTLHASASGYASFEEQVSVKAGSSSLDVSVTLTHGATMAGSVRLSGPGSLTGARIDFTNESDPNGSTLSANLDSDGSFRIRGFRPGTWRLVVFGTTSASGGTPSAFVTVDGSTFTVQAGDTEVREDVVVAEGGSLTIRVEDPRFPGSVGGNAENPSSKAREKFGEDSSLRVLDSEDRVVREAKGVRRGYGSQLHYAYLLTGDYTVVLTTPDGATKKQTVHIEAGKRATAQFAGE